MGLHCCTWAFSSCSEQKLLSNCSAWTLIEEASLALEDGL